MFFFFNRMYSTINASYFLSFEYQPILRYTRTFLFRLVYNVVMALRGWRLFGVAGTIFAYVAGILLLSILSLNNPNQRRGRGGGRFGEVTAINSVQFFVLFKISFFPFSLMHSDTVKSI